MVQVSMQSQVPKKLTFPPTEAEKSVTEKCNRWTDMVIDIITWGCYQDRQIPTHTGNNHLHYMPHQCEATHQIWNQSIHLEPSFFNRMLVKIMRIISLSLTLYLSLNNSFLCCFQRFYTWLQSFLWQSLKCCPLK